MFRIIRGKDNSYANKRRSITWTLMLPSIHGPDIEPPIVGDDTMPPTPPPPLQIPSLDSQGSRPRLQCLRLGGHGHDRMLHINSSNISYVSTTAASTATTTFITTTSHKLHASLSLPHHCLRPMHETSTIRRHAQTSTPHCKEHTPAGLGTGSALSSRHLTFARLLDRQP